MMILACSTESPPNIMLLHMTHRQLLEKEYFVFLLFFFLLSLLFLGTELFGSLCVCEHGHVTLKLIRMVSFRQSMNAIILVYCIIFCIWCLLQ